MSAITASLRRPASHSRPKIGQSGVRKRPLARGVTPPASRASVRHYSPKEFAAALARGGITVCERHIARRCALPASDSLYIASNPHFPGRYWIPETELTRLLGAGEAA